MRDIWNKMAIQDGFDGIYFIATITRVGQQDVALRMRFDAQMEYQPRLAMSPTKKIDFSLFYYFKRKLYAKYFNIPCKTDYSYIWERVISQKYKRDITTFLGAYTGWDTTARWGGRGEVHINNSPDIFKKYFAKQVKRSIEMQNEFIFITAWNEWSEGAFLEPDEYYKYKYLEAVKECLE